MIAAGLACEAAAVLLSAWAYLATARDVRPFRWPLSSSCQGGAKPPASMVEAALRGALHKPPGKPKPSK